MLGKELTFYSRITGWARIQDEVIYGHSDTMVDELKSLLSTKTPNFLNFSFCLPPFSPVLCLSET